LFPQKLVPVHRVTELELILNVMAVVDGGGEGKTIKSIALIICDSIKLPQSPHVGRPRTLKK
jgi:hypothetical protein